MSGVRAAFLVFPSYLSGEHLHQAPFPPAAGSPHLWSELGWVTTLLFQEKSPSGGPSF